MKLAIAIRIISIIQILLYVVAMLMIYWSPQNSFDGLRALLPFGIFGVLGIANIILCIIYIIRVARKRSKIDIVALILTTIVICLALLYSPIVEWALRGPI